MCEGVREGVREEICVRVCPQIHGCRVDSLILSLTSFRKHDGYFQYFNLYVFLLYPLSTHVKSEDMFMFYLLEPSENSEQVKKFYQCSSHTLHQSKIIILNQQGGG